MTVFKGEDYADPQLSSIPRVPKLFLLLNVVVCVKVFIHLSLKQLGYLFLLKIQNKKIFPIFNEDMTSSAQPATETQMIIKLVESKPKRTTTIKCGMVPPRTMEHETWEINSSAACFLQS